MTAEPNRLTFVPLELGRPTFLADLKPLPLVDPTEAAQFLNVARHTLACYRCLGEGPAYYKFGRWVRYELEDLLHWRDGASVLGSSPRKEPKSPGMLLVTPEIAARFLTVTLPCLRRYRIEGIGPRYLRYSNRIYYPVHELYDWVKNRRHSPCEKGFRRPRQATRSIKTRENQARPEPRTRAPSY